MNSIDTIIKSAEGPFRAAIEAAYKAGFDDGRSVGERTAADNLKSKLASLFDSDDTGATKSTDINTPLAKPADSQASDDSERAAPGTVKPVILKLVSESRNGIATRDVARATGFKYNSVRGTLWTLQKERAVTRNEEGRWISTARTNEASADVAADASKIAGEVGASPIENRERQDLLG